jgi:DNA-binding CsgD family transcriptional regulator
MSQTGGQTQPGVPAKGPTLVRRLALLKLRDLRAAGLSFSEIGRRFGAASGAGTVGPSGFEYRLRPERLLLASVAPADTLTFMRTLDLVHDGLAFFNLSETLVFANAAFRRFGNDGRTSTFEIAHFVHTLATLAHARHMEAVDHVEEIELREMHTTSDRYFLRGSFIGFDLFGNGPLLLVQVEHSARWMPDEAALRDRFGLTRAEVRVAELLASGKSNEQIATALFMSPHTARTHTKRIMSKLQVKSRAEIPSRLQVGTAPR